MSSGIAPTVAPRRKRASNPEDLWQRAREAGWAGNPERASRLCERALRLIASDGSEPELHGRILLSLAYQRSELGDYVGAMAAIVEAEQVNPAVRAMARSNSAVLLSKLGRHRESLEHFEQAIEELERSGSFDLAMTLLNRGTLYMTLGRLSEAESDTRRAYELGRSEKHDALQFMAMHNLGYIQFLAGNLPGSLDLMARAARAAPESALGVSTLDRARVLTASGMFSEAGESVQRALDIFGGQRAYTDLVDALLASGELALLRGDQVAAKHQARAAARISRRREHRTAALLAELLALRADAIAFDPVRSSRMTPPTRATLRSAAARAEDMAVQLDEVGLIEDARTARLVLADARLLLGDLDGAGMASEQAGEGNRKPNLGIRMHHSLVKARIALASGSRTDALAEIAKGLDDLANFMARFGSQDMQAAASVHGAALARTGLRTALETGEPSVILPWLERSRAATTRLPAIRPPNDPQLVEELAKLRVAVRAARAATVAGKTDRALEREIIERRARIRARTWTTGGAKGKAHRPMTMTSVQRHLREHEPETTVLAYFRGEGKVHALVVTARRAGYRVLEDRAVIERRLARIGADLDLLAAPRIGAPVRTVANRSLQSGLVGLADLLVDPIADLLGPGRLRIAVVGRLGTAPWGLLPGLIGRAISVTPSITTALALTADTAPAHERGVLAVAGPDVRGGEAEALAIGERHVGSQVLIGEKATGEAVLAGIPAGGLLHIAAHGHHVPESPMFSAVLLADGPLFGYDIAPNPTLPSHVVLSSCDVGQSADQPGGEPLGLAAALLRSGVRTVVAGVSRINDSVAATVMTAYHDRLLEGADPAAALAAALDVAGDVPAPLTCFGV